MSAAGPVAPDPRRLCHAEVWPVGPGESVDAVRAELAEGGRRLAELAGRGAAGGGRLWVEDVPAGSSDAAAWRERELARGVDPAIGPAARQVLLRYADGAADLVVVANRAAEGGSAELAELAAALRRLDAVPAPDWGLGDPRAGTAVGRHDFVLPGEDGGDAEITVTAALGLVLPRQDCGDAEITVTAALGLVLARYTGRSAVVIGGADPRRSVVLPVDPASTVDAYLRAVLLALDAATAPAEEAPLVGLAVTVAGAAPAASAGIAPDSGIPGIRDSCAPNGPSAAGRPAPAAVRPFLAPVQPLSIHVGGGPVLHGTCWYRRRHFGPRIVEQFARHLATAHRNLVHQVSTAPRTPVGEVDVLDPPELRRLAELGGLGRPLPPLPPGCERIDNAVAAQAARTPYATAVTCGEEHLSYAELDARADRAASALRAAGVRAGARVGVCLDRSPDLVVVLLAVLRAGAAYVPMDPSYPAERLAFTAADAGLALVVGSADAVPGLDGVPVIPPEDLDLPATAAPGDGRAPDDPAYVIYTSGSTGTPKGVVVPHRNVTSLLAATRDDFGLGSDDVWTQFHSCAFDFSVWEIWGCLMTGGRLVLVPYWVSRSPEEFAALLAAERVTVLNQTPSAFAQLMDVDRQRPLPDSLRLVVFGGEPLDTGPLLPWLDRHPESRCRLVNMFGITETTVHVTAQTVTRAQALAGSRSVGRPLPGWQVYVLDPDGRPVPPGVAGEIHVGGAGVATHYLNRPELTRQRFLPDPFAAGSMYRSGDRGRLLPDGRLEHLGRLDDQVQLRGHRIELDEVRARLLAAPGVTAATVVLHQRGDAATALLAGYVVFRDGLGDPDEVRRHAAGFLPDYMVPATVTALPALPLTPNGKVDLARLVPPSNGAPSSRHDVASSPTAAAVLHAWEGVFGFRVGEDDDFFALGGNSLLAVRLSAALRAAGLPAVGVRQLYTHRTAGRLTAMLRAAIGEVRSA